MIFALAHATLGWGLAFLACLLLRRRAAKDRGWAWRLGLLKGPLALLLAVPVVVAQSPSPFRERDPLTPMASRIETRVAAPRTTESLPAPALPASEPRVPVAEPTPPSRYPLAASLLYGAGVAAVLFARLVAARRAHGGMPRVEGVFRPRIVVPDGLGPQEAAMARAHEAAHVRRRDPQWSFVADLCCAALWFAPPVWLCARAMRLEAEAACDAAALEVTGAAKRSYAALLLDFAGPAPANALGGPARRLARRILMLDNPAKPLPRLVAVLFLALGFAVLLPWQAVAAQSGPDKGPLRGFGAGVPADRLPLKTAASLMLEEPGVRDRVGWTAEQDAAAKAGEQRWEAVVNAFRAEIVRRQKTQTLKAAFEWDERERRAMFAAAEKAGGPPPQTPEQAQTLKSLALARFGSAIWKDPEVVRRLRLTAAQIAAVTAENEAILRATRNPDMRGGLYRPTPKMPKAVADRLKALNAAYLVAPRDQRRALYAKIANVERPYQPVFRGQKPGEYRARKEAQIAKSWRMRVEADRRLMERLTAAQREALRRLTSDPAAWQTPVDSPTPSGSAKASERAARVSADLTRTRARLDLKRAQVARVAAELGRRKAASGGDPIRLQKVLARQRESLRAQRALLRRQVAATMAEVVGRTRARVSHDLTGPASQGAPANVLRPSEGSSWKIYRTGRAAPYQYQIERVPARPSGTGPARVKPKTPRP